MFYNKYFVNVNKGPIRLRYCDNLRIQQNIQTRFS